MTSTQERIGIKWNEGTRYWQIFGILPDHRFYGEYIDWGNGKGFKRLEGTVSPADHLRIVSLVERIKGLPLHTETNHHSREVRSYLFEGFRNDPHILFVRFETEPALIHDELFAEIVEIMKKYCAHVTEV